MLSPRARARFSFAIPMVLSRITRSLFGRYGRFSKSIRPDEVGACPIGVTPSPVPVSRIADPLLTNDGPLRISHRIFVFTRPRVCVRIVCGACRTGTLRPLFTVRAKTSSRMTANGRMAATSPRGAFFFCHLGGCFCISVLL